MAPSLKPSYLEDFLLYRGIVINGDNLDIVSNVNNGLVASNEGNKLNLAQEESAIESKIVDLISNGDWQSLQPNTGRSVDIRGSHVCVDYREEPGSGYRTWEWHGHCMIYEEGEGYNAEYIYGNHFEPLMGDELVPESPARLPTATLGSPVGLGAIISGLETTCLRRI